MVTLGTVETKPSSVVSHKRLELFFLCFSHLERVQRADPLQVCLHRLSLSTYVFPFARCDSILCALWRCAANWLANGSTLRSGWR